MSNKVANRANHGDYVRFQWKLTAISNHRIDASAKEDVDYQHEIVGNVQHGGKKDRAKHATDNEYWRVD